MTEASAWFAGPKGENGDWFAGCITKILQDYYSWRRNYYPEDGLVIDAESRRAGEVFQDLFDDRLFELLAKLKADFPFQSPRYAAHMLSEQTMPAIAGYFAAMLYNPNNVSSEAAPVTVRLEIEAAQMIAKMVGFGPDSWAHLTSGGTVANIEALWMARTVKYLPLVLEDMRQELGIQASTPAFGSKPSEVLTAFAAAFENYSAHEVIRAYLGSKHNVVEQGIGNVLQRLGSRPFLLAPETQHYSILKSLDVLGLGRQSLVRVRVDSDFRMNIDDLAEKLDVIHRRGDHVLAVVPIVGTTEEGAVDPVEEVIRLRETSSSSFWVHADAAYGGYLRTVVLPDRMGLGHRKTIIKVHGEEKEIPICLPEAHFCETLSALAECDSVTIDPHKLGYVPYPAGAVCFRSDIVKPLARQEAPYIEDDLGDVQTERSSQSIGVYVLEGSKPGAAAASVWLSHTLIPLDRTGHGKLMKEGIRNASELHALLGAYPDFVAGQRVRAIPICQPGSNILCFAFRSVEPIGLRKLNAWNHAIYERFSVSDVSGKRVYDQPFFLSRTSLHAHQYSLSTVAPFLNKLGVSGEEYEAEGVFLMRSVLMNPWYAEAKRKGRYFISELVESLFQCAGEVLEGIP